MRGGYSQERSYIQSFIRREYYLLVDIAQMYEKLRNSTYQFMDFIYMQVQMSQISLYHFS